jgi:uncharacterized damage-inducible protein DinB
MSNIEHSLETVLTELDDQVSALTEVLSADDEALWAEPAAGEWSAAMVLVHLSDAELHVAARLRYLLTEDSPTFPNWSEEEHAALSDTRSPEIALAVIAAVRAANADLVRNADPARLERTAILPDGEVVGPVELLGRHVRHNAAHIDQANAALRG